MVQTPDYPMTRSQPFGPPDAYASARERSPLVKVKLWNGSMPWLALTHAAVRKILADARFSISPEHAGFPFVSESRASMLRSERHNFAFTDPPRHTTLRRMLTRIFSIQNVASMRPMVEEVVDKAIIDLRAKPQPADFVTEFALPIPSTVIARLLGVPYEDHEFFQDCAQTRVDLRSSPEDVAAAGKRAYDYLDRLLRTREEQPDGDDILSVLAREQVLPGHASHEDAVGMARVILLAGHDTTATMIAAGTLSLLMHPEQKIALTEGKIPVGTAVEEMLRFWSIAQHNAPRVATEDVEIEGVLVRAGEGVLASLPAANFDPAVFAEPETFDSARARNPHVAFAFGPHQCLGQALARLELETVFSRLFSEFPNLRLAVPIQELSFKNESMTYGPSALPVEWS